MKWTPRATAASVAQTWTRSPKPLGEEIRDFTAGFEPCSSSKMVLTMDTDKDGSAAASKNILPKPPLSSPAL